MTQQSFEPTPSVGALFDLSFTRFITVSVIKIIYILGMLLLGLMWIGIVITAFSNGFLSGLVGIVVATIVAVIYLLMMRVWLELIVVLFRIGENTSAIAQSMGASNPTGGFPVMPAAPT